MDVVIRRLETVGELKACERLQRAVWSMPDDLDVIPLHLLISAQRNGGLVLGAFAGQGLVGLLFGYPGITADGRPKHCSHLMGIAPEVQGRGIGYRLKLAQRQFALAQGCDLITWTYDPLESRNANLNIHKLGAVCRTYFRDYYGPMEDGLNCGLPSDRFQVDWWIASNRVGERLSCLARPASEDEQLLDQAMRRKDGASPESAVACEAGNRMLVEVPADFQRVRATDAESSAGWRSHTRRVFEQGFAWGYAVTDFVWRQGRAFYLLTKETNDDAH